MVCAVRGGIAALWVFSHTSFIVRPRCSKYCALSPPVLKMIQIHTSVSQYSRAAQETGYVAGYG